MVLTMFSCLLAIRIFIFEKHLFKSWPIFGYNFLEIQLLVENFLDEQQYLSSESSLNAYCFSLDPECPSKAHVLMAWSSGWHYQEVVEPLGDRYSGHWGQALKRDHGTLSTEGQIATPWYRMLWLRAGQQLGAGLQVQPGQGYTISHQFFYQLYTPSCNHLQARAWVIDMG